MTYDTVANRETLVAGMKFIEQCGVVVKYVTVELENHELPGRSNFVCAFLNFAFNLLFAK